METKTNYTFVGLMVLVLTTGLVLSAVWLSFGFKQKTYIPYAVYLHEAVSGLTEESPVKYNGVQVGFVRQISLNPADPRQVRLLLNIESGTPITVSTYATLISQGITGTTYVGLSATSGDLTPLGKIPKEPYPIIPAKPSLFTQLDKVMKEITENINRVSINIEKVLSPKNVHNFKVSLANLKGFTDTLNRNSPNINRSLKNIAKASENFPQLVQDLKEGAHKMQVMADAMTKAGENFSTTMAAGKTTVEKISQQTIPPAVILLRRLDHIAANLEKVSAQMRQNPAVVIRGSTPPKPGPGEK